MLRSNTKAFSAKLQNLIIDTINCEDGANLKENLEITLENMKAGRDGNWGYLKPWERPQVLSMANVQYFIQSVGGGFQYCETKQIEELASLYCENDSEKAAYIEHWNKVLDRKGYEPILQHYAYIMLKGLEKVFRANNIKTINL